MRNLAVTTAPILGSLRRCLRIPLLSFSTISSGDTSDYEPEPPTAGAVTDLTSFLNHISHARSISSTYTEALSLLRASPPPRLPASSDAAVRAVWALRGDWDAALLALRLVEEAGVGVEAWHVALWAAGKSGRFDVAWGIVRRMHRRRLLTCRAMVILIERYAAAGEAGKAIKTFKFMEKFKLNADASVFHALLRALCKNKNVEEAEDFLLLQRNIFPMSTEGFNIILDGWCNVMTEEVEARRVWKNMQRCSLSPDRNSYSHMISCFSKSGNLFDSLRLYDEMKRKGFTPDLVVYNCLVYVLTRENCLEDARNIVRKIIEDGLRPNVETYNSMIAPLCDANNLEDARVVMEDMMLMGVAPNSDTYNSLLKDEDASETLNILHRMNDIGCSPNKHTFLRLINNYFLCDASEKALKMFSEMRKYGIAPDSSHYMALVQGLLNHGWIPKALEYYNEMKNEGFPADPVFEKHFKAWMWTHKDHWGVKKFIIHHDSNRCR